MLFEDLETAGWKRIFFVLSCDSLSTSQLELLSSLCAMHLIFINSVSGLFISAKPHKEDKRLLGATSGQVNLLCIFSPN